MPIRSCPAAGRKRLDVPGVQVYGATHLNKSAPFDLAWVHRKLVADAYETGDAAEWLTSEHCLLGHGHGGVVGVHVELDELDHDVGVARVVDHLRLARAASAYS